MQMCAGLMAGLMRVPVITLVENVTSFDQLPILHVIVETV